MTKIFNRVWHAALFHKLGSCDIFDGVWHGVLFHKLGSCGFSGQVFRPTLFLSNKLLYVFLDRISLLECPFNGRTPIVTSFGPTPFLIYIDNLPDLSVMLLLRLLFN